MRRFLHWHRDPDWTSDGVHRYSECRCGARRTRRLTWRIYVVLQPGWPPMMDRHGLPADDSGWVPRPPGGWPKTIPTLRPPVGPADPGV